MSTPLQQFNTPQMGAVPFKPGHQGGLKKGSLVDPLKCDLDRENSPPVGEQNMGQDMSPDGFSLLDMLDEEIEKEERREEQQIHSHTPDQEQVLQMHSHSFHEQEPVHDSPLIENSMAAAAANSSLPQDEAEDSMQDEDAASEVAETPPQQDEASSTETSGARPGETDEERARREELDSMNLARQLMAEESLNAYREAQMAVQNSLEGEDSEEARVFRLAMELERQDEAAEELEVETGEDDSIDPDNMGYEALLELGENIGDVAKERWRMDAQRHIDSLPVRKWDGIGLHTRCLVCQYDFEEGDIMRTLPCGHEFHTECVDEWLANNKSCPTCKASIISDECGVCGDGDPMVDAAIGGAAAGADSSTTA